MSAPPKVVLFDIDDTLCATTLFARKARLSAVRAMIGAGLDATEDEVTAELDEILKEFTSNYDHHYDRLLQRLDPTNRGSARHGLIVAAGIIAYHDTKSKELKPFDDVIPLFKDLAASSARLGIITHGWTIKQAEKLIRLGLIPYVDRDAIFISDQIGIAKPNPKLYKFALKKLGVEPHEVVYIGDNLVADIAPPRDLGMHAVWAKRAAKKTMEETGVRAEYEVSNFAELRALLRERFELEIPAQ